MDNVYVHFTDKEGAEAIIDSMILLACSYVSAVFAIVAGGVHFPSTQRGGLGRATNRDWAVVFTTSSLPDGAYPEEVTWHLEELKLLDAEIMTAEEAITLLDGSLVNPADEDELIDGAVTLHPTVFDYELGRRRL